jgi:plasmid maintenance system antidote protein VapI
MDDNLCDKIARLVQERGWNLEEFARQAELNRLTVRSIIQGGERRLHNATVAACARALGLGVDELRQAPVERLLPRMHAPVVPGESLRRMYETASQPELAAWMERNPERASKLTPDELDELLSLQGTGGPLTPFGVSSAVERIERKRRLLEQAAVVASTEYIDMLEAMVTLMYEKVQPYKVRSSSRDAESDDTP